ncbi:MAG: hypothetical protein M0R06_25820 [Sphaerochaeta sp.]|jgi:hypothetical protein|nr:hypothetical protein [Sphaerochaeta sp.]
MKIVVNKRYGGFGLSDVAYEWLNKNAGIPIVKYIEEKRGEDGRYKKVPSNEGEKIFDRKLSEKDESGLLGNRYWDSFIRDYGFRNDSRLINCVEDLGQKANGRYAELVVVEVPDGIEYEIDDYDGIETIREKHRSW